MFVTRNINPNKICLETASSRHVVYYLGLHAVFYLACFVQTSDGSSVIGPVYLAGCYQRSYPTAVSFIAWNRFDKMHQWRMGPQPQLIGRIEEGSLNFG